MNPFRESASKTRNPRCERLPSPHKITTKSVIFSDNVGFGLSFVLDSIQTSLHSQKHSCFSQHTKSFQSLFRRLAKSRFLLCRRSGFISSASFRLPNIASHTIQYLELNVMAVVFLRYWLLR